MATIRKLRGRWQAQVRRRGMAPRAKSFDQKADAEKWARSLESELDRCGMLPDTRVAESTTLRSILERYMIEISPRKRSAHTEISRIKALLRRPLCHRTLALLSTSDLATYRDERLRSVSPSTVIRELNTISHAIDTAMRDWDVYLHRNPCKLVRRPSPPRGRKRRLRDDEEQRLSCRTACSSAPRQRTGRSGRCWSRTTGSTASSSCPPASSGPMPASQPRSCSSPRPIRAAPTRSGSTTARLTDTPSTTSATPCCRPRSSARCRDTATAAQIEFVGLVIEHLTHQGTMDPGLLYEPPFTDIAPTGPEQVFDEPRIGKLFSRIQELNESAVA